MDPNFNFPGWACMTDQRSGRKYFINLTEKTTTWEDPRLKVRQEIRVPVTTVQTRESIQIHPTPHTAEPQSHRGEVRRTPNVSGNHQAASAGHSANISVSRPANSNVSRPVGNASHQNAINRPTHADVIQSANENVSQRAVNNDSHPVSVVLIRPENPVVNRSEIADFSQSARTNVIRTANTEINQATNSSPVLPIQTSLNALNESPYKSPRRRAMGPNAALRCQRSYTPCGPNRALCKGPKAGLAMGSVYAQTNITNSLPNLRLLSH